MIPAPVECFQDPLILSFSRNLALAKLPFRVAISASGYGGEERTLLQAAADILSPWGEGRGEGGLRIDHRGSQ
jgi:hypothetical protein